ncbi:MAG: hypothetical protein Q7J58_20470 [Hydrogenophaga sp.]|jgi:hypothetical protein|uniref:hypothetical protein n=1 Tax=Hydrogenophaga sp. TaxID=1904254 RepID=UPI002719EC10|nr:hypothetical protein [Hydrogenophaga sp.]MDO9199772.1 hypothetical protein [Hydrogenophaga sp.]MDO9571731.1 hypothetical protein [Hydrogenophaga sp.]MDP2164580.1 hypothetical protein [Hydrogenophaga sp.]
MSDEHWGRAFGRQATIQNVLEFVVTHWQQLQKRPPPDMEFSQSEPHITKYFGLSLKKSARAHGIFGFFVPEHVVGDIDEVRQVLESRGRTDLTYLSDRIDPPLEFVLEFKKMKSQTGANASRLAYCKDGMLRFVNATYARNEEVGFMVALVACDADLPGLLDGLKRAIQQPDMARLLRSIANPKGRTTLTASDLVFQACNFETRHARDHKGQKDVVLGHIMLAHQTSA